MKPFVRLNVVAPEATAVLCMAIVAVTHASAAATYAIAFGLASIMLAVRLGPERTQLWREKNAGNAPVRRRSGAGRSTGSR